jgi:hypothetical protein
MLLERAKAAAVPGSVTIKGAVATAARNKRLLVREPSDTAGLDVVSFIIVFQAGAAYSSSGGSVEQE